MHRLRLLPFFSKIGYAFPLDVIVWNEFLCKSKILTLPYNRDTMLTNCALFACLMSMTSSCKLSMACKSIFMEILINSFGLENSLEILTH